MGMSTTQNGIISAVDRILGMFIPPTLGWITDKTRKPKGVIFWLFFTGAIFVASLYFIPPEKKHFDQTGQSIQASCFPVSCKFLNSEKASCDNRTLTSLKCASESQILQVNTSRESCSLLRQNTTSFQYEEVIPEEFLAGGMENLLPVTNVINHVAHLNTSLANITSFACKANVTFVPSFNIDLRLASDIFKNTTENICLCIHDITSQSQEDEYGATFWCLMVIFVLTSISVFGGTTVVDSMILGVFPEKERHNFGLQRMWGAVGFGAAPILIGLIKDAIAAQVTDPNSNLIFTPVFFAPAFFWSILCIVTWNLSSKVVKDLPDQKIKLSGIKILLTNVRIFPFLVLITTVGYSIAVGELYMFWLAEDRFNATSTTLAMTTTVASSLDVLTYIVSGTLIRKFGPRLMMTGGLFIMGVRLFLYTLVTEAWHLIFAEALRGVSWPLTWIAACHHIANISPPGLAATTMGLVQALLYGLGYGSGALLGGYLFEQYGGDDMFRISFAMTAAVSFFYFVVYKCIDSFGNGHEQVKNEEENERLKQNDVNGNGNAKSDLLLVDDGSSSSCSDAKL
ncbi:major facilitator superfamily domain-containing protein 6-like isoform X2 [Clavelina lepadiformis]